MSLPPQLVLGWAAGAATLALAILVLWLDPQKRANRALALLLFCRALATFVGFSARGADQEGALSLYEFAPYLLILIIPAALHFAATYPRARWHARWRVGTWILIGITVAFELAYFNDHSLYATFQAGSTATPLLQFVDPSDGRAGWYASEFGPFILFSALQAPVIAALGVIFAQDYVLSTTRTARFSSFLVASGFILNGLFDGTRALFGLHGIGGVSGWALAFAVLPVLALVPALLAITLMVRHRASDVQADHLEHRLMIAGALAALSALTVPLIAVVSPGMLAGESGFFSNPVTVFILGIWRLALPVLAVYAMLRYTVVDVDGRMRIGLKWGFLVLQFGLVYAAASSIGGFLFNLRSAPWIGLFFTVLASLALPALLRAANAAANAVLPTTLTGEANPNRYHEIHQMLTEDGQLTEAEQRMLGALRRRVETR